MQILSDGRRLPTVTDTAILGFFGEYRFLSNFHPCKIEIDGFEFATTEAAYMAQKSKDVKDWIALSSAQNPSAARKYGQTIKLREDWDTYRVIAMMNVTLQKFADPVLQELLLDTGNKYLEETNNWGDRFWGVDGYGKNMLGRTLMYVRDFYTN